jgi:hypothetical protein
VLDKVSFIVAGAQKGGTTALDHYLREHPEVCMPRQVMVAGRLTGEVHFFDTDKHFQVEPVDYTPYHASFDPRPPQRLVGEVTPSYMFWPTAPERIARYNSAMKLIVVLRNPITRAYSQWNMARQNGRESLPFMEALRVEPERQRNLPPRRAKRFSYVERGFYVGQLQRLWQYFPVAQTVVFRSEELIGRPAEVLTRIADFLGIASFPPLAEKTVNAREYDTAMSADEKRYLIGVFEQEVHALERLLGWDCSAWLR